MFEVGARRERFGEELVFWLGRGGNGMMGGLKISSIGHVSSFILKWIHHTDAAVVLAVAQVLGEQFARTAGMGSGKDHGVP